MKNVLEENISFFRASKFDFVFIGLILFLSAFFIVRLFNSRIRQDSQSNIALIYQGNALLEQIDLSKDRIIEILGGKMRIQTEKRRLRIARSDCLQHICMNMGWIQYSGQTIVCVPNQVLVEIKSKGNSVVDAVTF